MRLLSTAFIGLSLARASVASAQPISIGFELEDSSIEYKTVQPPAPNCRNHRAKLNPGAYVSANDMIIGADSHAGDYCDLEIRSQPMLLGNDKAIDNFLINYVGVYENPLNNIDGVQQRQGTAGSLIAPQLTISMPIARLGDLADVALFATDDEVAAVRAFNQITATVDHTALDGNATQVQLVDGVGRFMAMYLAGVWPKVTLALVPVVQKRYLYGARAISSDKKNHSLFLKEVERDGSRRNGFVDLYWVLRKAFPGKEAELHKSLDALLQQTLAQLAKGGTVKSKDLDPLKAFTTEYLMYVAAEAARIDEKHDAYQPGEFVPTAQIKLADGMHGLYFPELESLRDSFIKPLSGQDSSVYVEERRLTGTPRQNVANDGNAAVAIASLKAPESTDRPEKHAQHAADVLREMVRFYQRFFVVELSAKPTVSDNNNDELYKD